MNRQGCSYLMRQGRRKRAGRTVIAVQELETRTLLSAPSVTGLSVTQGFTYGDTYGDQVTTITGTGFTGASAVLFGSVGVPQGNFTVASDTSIKADVPVATTAGPVDVRVISSGMESPPVMADQFTYVTPPAPTVTGVSASSGFTAGGDKITISGTNLDGALTVNFGSTPATNVTQVSNTSITAVNPAEVAGKVDVTVTTVPTGGGGGTSPVNPPADQFTYTLPPAPTFNFSIPGGVASSGQSVYFYMIGQLIPSNNGGAGYTPTSGPNKGQLIPAGTSEGTYLDLLNTATSGPPTYDWSEVTANEVLTPFQTISLPVAAPPGQFSVTLPSTYATGRIVMFVGATAPNFTANSSGGVPAPVPASFPNTVYDFAEFAYDAPVQGTTSLVAGIPNLDTDLTQVDQVGFPFTITTSTSSMPASSSARGVTPSRTTEFSQFTQDVPSTFQPLADGAIRILSPTDYLGLSTTPDTDPLNAYFNTELSAFFTQYEPANSFQLYRDNDLLKGNTATVTDTMGDKYTVLQLTAYSVNSNGSTGPALFNGQPFNIYEPFFSTNTTGEKPLPNPTLPPPPSWLTNTTESPGEMVFANDGVFNSGSNDPSAPDAGLLSDVENSIVSAFNRGVATSIAPNDWINAPSGLSATPGNAGVTPDNLVSGTPYYYVITDVNSAGETVASNEVTVTPTGNNPSVTLTWVSQDGPAQGTPLGDSPVGVQSYNIYRGTAVGGEQLIMKGLTNDVGVNNDPAVSFMDTGLPVLGPVQTPPIYYASGSTSNWYAAFLHQNSSISTSGISIGGFAYGFAYDDQGGNSTNIQGPTPASATITLGAWSPYISPSAVSLAQTAQTITINGNGFDVVPGNNTVTFSTDTAGAHPDGTATVTAVNATGTQLTATFAQGSSPAPGPLYAQVKTIEGGASGLPAVQVATVTAQSTPTPQPTNTTPSSSTTSVVQQSNTGGQQPSTPTPTFDLKGPTFVKVVDGAVSFRGKLTLSTTSPDAWVRVRIGAPRGYFHLLRAVVRATGNFTRGLTIEGPAADVQTAFERLNLILGKARGRATITMLVSEGTQTRRVTLVVVS